MDNVSWDEHAGEGIDIDAMINRGIRNGAIIGYDTLLGDNLRI